MSLVACECRVSLNGDDDRRREWNQRALEQEGAKSSEGRSSDESHRGPGGTAAPDLYVWSTYTGARAGSFSFCDSLLGTELR